MVRVLSTKAEMARAAADHAAGSLRALLSRQRTVRLLAATGASQIDVILRHAVVC